MTEPRGAPAPALTRNLLIPSSIVLCFVLVYVVGVRVAWVIPVGVAFMLLYVVAPVIGRRSLARFDRDAVQLLARGRSRDLSARLSRALGMRLFAPPALVAERRGMVAAETGAPSDARDAFREASEGWGSGAPLSVRLGLAHASFTLGDDEEAIRGYRSVLAESPGLPNVARNLAHALARSGQDLDEAARLADDLRSLTSAPSPELTLVRALIHAKKGERADARKLLKGVPKSASPAAAALREAVRDALAER